MTNPAFTMISYSGTTVTWNGMASATINTSRKRRFPRVLRMFIANAAMDPNNTVARTPSTVTYALLPKLCTTGTELNDVLVVLQGKWRRQSQRSRCALLGRFKGIDDNVIERQRYARRYGEHDGAKDQFHN